MFTSQFITIFSFCSISHSAFLLNWSNLRLNFSLEILKLLFPLKALLIMLNLYIFFRHASFIMCPGVNVVEIIV